MAFVRAQSEILAKRLTESVERIQIIAGPRQVGKSTLVRQTLMVWQSEHITSIATEPGDIERAETNTVTQTYRPDARRDTAWLIDAWQRARNTAKQNAKRHVLVIDEIQKIPQWSEVVKGPRPTVP